MSGQAAQAFIEKMKTDEAFRARVMAVEEIAALGTKLEDAELGPVTGGDEAPGIVGGNLKPWCSP